MARYLGLRATLTQLPSGGDCLVTVSVKSPHGGWDEWGLLCPAVRLDLGPLGSATEAASALADGIHLVLRELER